MNLQSDKASEYRSTIHNARRSPIQRHRINHFLASAVQYTQSPSTCRNRNIDRRSNRPQHPQNPQREDR